MRLRCGILLLIVAVCLETGCQKSGPAGNAIPVQDRSRALTVPPAAAAQPADVIARIHWLGKRQIAAGTNGTILKDIWVMPESVKLENQTLEKLAFAPWTLPKRKPDTNAGGLLRPLLDDVLQQEWYLEVRQATNQPGQLAFVIRLNEQRAALWVTNLAAVLKSLTGVEPATAAGNLGGWTLKQQHQPDFIRLTRAGEWTILAAGADQNPVLDEIVSRVQRGHAPLGYEVSNDWFQAVLDLGRLPGAVSAAPNLSGDWPRISIAVAGEGTNVHTRGEFMFAKLPPARMEPWNVPTSLMDGPLVSFAAIRGFEPWLASLAAWNELRIGPPPNQFYGWSLPGRGMDTYAAAPLPEASNEVFRLTALVMQKWEPWFATNEMFAFRRAETFNGLEWQGLPWLTPSLQSSVISNGDFILVSTFPNNPMSPPPPDYFDKALAGSDLVYYGWEQTGFRTPQWLYISQFARFVSGKAQMPFDCASLNWLKAIGPNLGLTVTRITSTGTGSFSLERTSSVGFTGIELHLLADWLESPQFPIGLHTFLVPRN